jgi:glyceraldehyde 3-phosphate dehydrogenase
MWISSLNPLENLRIEGLEHPIRNGASKVILQAPPLEVGTKALVLGVNDHILHGNETIISNAYCTTNNVATMIDIMRS